VQGAVGFGLALVAAPLVALVEPTLVPGPMLLAALVLPLLTAARDWRSIDVAGIKWALVGRVPGSLLGAALLARLPPAATSLVVGLVVLAGVAMTASGLRVRATAATLVGAGVVSGLMGTATSVGGPPLALVYQHATGPVLRGTLSAYFAVAAAISILSLTAVGRFGAEDVRAGLALLPGVGLGFLASGPAARTLDRGHTRVAVLAVSALAGMILVLRQLA
jgi:hypothetical protein